MTNASTLTGPVVSAAADLLSDSSRQLHTLGSYCETADGRGFRYFKCGATATVPGKVYAAAAWDNTNQAPVGGLEVAAAAIGDTSVTISTSTTLAANLLAGGYMVTDVTPGQGYIYKIAGNTATSGAANAVLTLADPLIIALTTASNIVLVKHPYDSVIVSPGGASTGQPVGVSSYIVTASQYGWMQTYGAAPVLAGVATSISLPGVPVTVSASTAGSVIVSTAILPTIGWAMQLMTATEYQLVYLTIH